MTDEQFIHELTKPDRNNILPFLEHDERIKKLSLEPQFKTWMMKHTEAGYSHDDEWFLYSNELELDRELGSRISWFTGLSNEPSIEVTEEGVYFPIYAQSFEYDNNKYWVVTMFGQGAISWIMTDLLFQQEYGAMIKKEDKMTNDK